MDPKHMKRYSALLIIREMDIKIVLRFHFNHEIGKNNWFFEGERWGNLSFYILLIVIQIGLIFLEANWQYLTKFKIHKSFEATVPYLSIYYICTKWWVGKAINCSTVCNSKRQPK